MGNNFTIDSKQLELLFREHYEGLGRYAISFLKNQVAAEEVVQKLFVNLWEKKDELHILDVKAYLYRSVYNSCMNELKKAQREKKHVAISENVHVQSTDLAHNKVLLNDLELQINQALDRLPDKCGEVFRLSRQQDLSYKEIAEHLDISIKTVENQMGKALRIMRVEMQSYLTECLLIFLFLQSW